VWLCAIAAVAHTCRYSGGQPCLAIERNVLEGVLTHRDFINVGDRCYLFHRGGPHHGAPGCSDEHGAMLLFRKRDENPTTKEGAHEAAYARALERFDATGAKMYALP
jgi:hypothetical protein